MRHQSKQYLPIILLVAGAVLLVLDVLNSAILHRWLGDWFIVRFHLPGILSLCFIFFGFISFYEYHGIGPQEGIIRRGSNRKIVALTFDDGPNPKFTPKILDILREKNAPAAFFMVGKHVAKYPDIARRIHSEGHEIGNHTFSHRDLVPATRKTVMKEVIDADEVITKVVGIRTGLFRPPRGIYSNAVRKIIVEELGYSMVLWTVSAVDWSGLSPKRIVRRVHYYVRNGGIILFHDSGAIIRTEGANRGRTVEALPSVIDELRSRGFEIVPLSELIQPKTSARYDVDLEDLAGEPLGNEI